MSLALRTARIFWLKKIVKWPAVRPVSLLRGLPPDITVFANARIN
jgi:hypothetical protein